MADIWYNIDAICSPSKMTGVTAEPAIPESLVGWYEECHIANYTRGSLFLLKAGDDAKVVEIKKAPLPYITNDHHVAVTYRTVNGSRERNRSGRLEADIEKHCWKIPDTEFKNKLVYLPEIASVLGDVNHKHTMLNPASKAYREALVRDLGEALSTVMYRHPVSLVANDPTGYHQRLYMIIHDEIVAVGVSHYVAEDAADTISLVRRNNCSGVPDNEFEVSTTSFAHLNRMPNHIWHVGKYHISSNRRSLEDYLRELKPVVPPECMLLSEHQLILARTEAEWTTKQQMLTDSHANLLELNRVLKETNTTSGAEIRVLKTKLEQHASPDHSSLAKELWELDSRTQYIKALSEAELAQRKIFDDQLRQQREELRWQFEERLRVEEMKLAVAKRRHEQQKWIIAAGIALLGTIKYWEVIAKFIKSLFSSKAVVAR